MRAALSTTLKTTLKTMLKTSKRKLVPDANVPDAQVLSTGFVWKPKGWNADAWRNFLSAAFTNLILAKRVSEHIPSELFSERNICTTMHMMGT